MLRLLKAAGCIVILSSATQAAFGQELPKEFLNRLMDECRPDYHRLCGEVLPGDGRVGRCLEDHQEALSPGCLKAVKYAFAIKACHADVQRYCPTVSVGDGRMVTCLADHMNGLEPSCERVVRANLPYAFPNGGRREAYAPSDRYDGRDYGRRDGYQGQYSQGYDGRYSQGYEGRYSQGYDGRFQSYDRPYDRQYGSRDERSEHDEEAYGEGSGAERGYEDRGDRRYNGYGRGGETGSEPREEPPVLK